HDSRASLHNTLHCNYREARSRHVCAPRHPGQRACAYAYVSGLRKLEEITHFTADGAYAKTTGPPGVQPGGSRVVALRRARCRSVPLHVRGEARLRQFGHYFTPFAWRAFRETPSYPPAHHAVSGAPGGSPPPTLPQWPLILNQANSRIQKICSYT